MKHKILIFTIGIVMLINIKATAKEIHFIGGKGTYATHVLVWLHNGGWSVSYSLNREHNQNTELAALAVLPWLDIASLRYPLVEEPNGTGMGPVNYIHDKIHELKNTHGYRTVYIGGYSAGGHLALLYSALYPDAVSKIIAIGAPSDLTASFNAVMRELVTAYVAGGSKRDYSPLYQISENGNKYLLFYQPTDNMIPFDSQFENFISKLSKEKIDFEYLIINDSVDHLFFKQGDGSSSTINNIVEKMKTFLSTDDFLQR